jgi:hypothetical protein
VGDEPHLGGPGDPALLLAADRLEGRAAIRARAGADLDEDEGVAVLRDEIDLAAAGAVVAGEDPETVGEEVVRGEPLGALAEVAPVEGRLAGIPLRRPPQDRYSWAWGWGWAWCGWA